MPAGDIIHVLNKRVQLHQPEGGFRTSLDSVMLAAACPAGPDDHMLDMGCGVGGAGYCVLARVPDTILTGIDIQDSHIELARENIALNNARGRADFLTYDIRDYAAVGHRFDHVICNPPYMEGGAHTISPSAPKATAHGHPDDMDTSDWLDAGFRLLKSGGSLTMIHRADTVDKIILGLKNRFGLVTIIPLWPRAGEPAKRVIVRAIKDRKTPAIIHPGLVLHQQDGTYTVEADAVLRDMKAIE